MQTLSLSQLSQQPSPQFDVVVVGAGMVGLSLACGLAERFERVLVIDAFPIKDFAAPHTPSFDDRSTALSWSSVSILQRLGVWQYCKEQACEIKRVHVSEQGRFGITEIDSEDSAAEALGYVMPNRSLGYALGKSLAGSGVSLLSPAQVSAIAIQDDGVQLGLKSAGSEEGEAQCHSKLLVIADGSDSGTAKRLGIGAQVKDYGQQAIICNVETSLSNFGVAYERFTKAGPLAMLPLQERVSALVWTMSPEQAEARISMSDAAFLRALQEQFSDRLGVLKACSQRVTYPLRLTIADEHHRRACLILGNAAHSLHPVAGQGFNLALRGVAHTLSGLTEARSEGMDVGDATLLARIAQAQRKDQQQTIQFSDQLVRTFGSKSQVMAALREGGLIALNNLPPLKRWFTQQAMGLGHALPLQTLEKV